MAKWTSKKSAKVAKNGKSDVSRQLEAAPSAMKVESIPGAAPGKLLEAA